MHTGLASSSYENLQPSYIADTPSSQSENAWLLTNHIPMCDCDIGHYRQRLEFRLQPRTKVITLHNSTTIAVGPKLDTALWQSERAALGKVGRREGPSKTYLGAAATAAEELQQGKGWTVQKGKHLDLTRCGGHGLALDWMARQILRFRMRC